MSHHVAVAKLKVLEVDDKTATYIVKCLEGLLTNGELVAAERDPDNATEVESIQRYQNVYVDQLEHNFGALLHLRRPLPPLLHPDCVLVSVAR